MGKSKRQPPKHEDTAGDTTIHSQLRDLGLEIRDMTGDGNCLFRSLSDQLTDSPSSHRIFREKVCNHIQDFPELYAPFVVDESLESRVQRMRKDGTYADHVELVAFARCMDVDIAVHQAGSPVWIIRSDGEGKHSNTSSKRQEVESRRLIHIVYHDYEHYSSVRSKGGQAPIVINPSNQNAESKKRSENGIVMDEKLVRLSNQISKITGVTDLIRIQKLLAQHGGNLNKTLEIIYNEMAEDDNVEHEDETEKTANYETPETPSSTANTPQQSEHVTTSLSTPSPEKPPNNGKIKHISAKARKEAKKRERKSNAMAKKRADNNTTSEMKSNSHDQFDNIVNKLDALMI